MRRTPGESADTAGPRAFGRREAIAGAPALAAVATLPGRHPAGTHRHHVLSAVSGSWWSGPFDPRGIPLALASEGSPARVPHPVGGRRRLHHDAGAGAARAIDEYGRPREASLVLEVTA